ncbi:MAG: carbon-nitrogen hydrolase family protein [Paenibacillus sp.]|nr:carbon-nitrogen hydrolase family protein [Paenibacillus sp.]
MANKVKISTLGAHYGTIREGSSGGWAQAIDDMKQHLSSVISQVLPDQPDLIVLPECCDMPANYSSEQRKQFYRERGDSILHFMAQIASDNSCHIAYPSMREAADGTWLNSVQLLGRSGDILGVYNKNHAVISEIMDDGVRCGKDAPIIECDFGRVGFAICFDLNFDQLRMQYVRAKPDLIVFPSMFHGGLMQQYWAYSCRAHFVGAIAGGLPSAILSPVGHTIAQTSSYYAYTSATVNLDCAVIHLDGHQAKLKAMRQKYGANVTVTDPSYLGSVLLASETDEATIQDILTEYDFKLLDDYMTESLSFHNNPFYREK